MVAVERTVLLLLAAGRSERFGDIGSKLDAPFLGRPLGLHIAVTLEDMAFAERIAVVNRATLDYRAHGFRVLRNEDAGSGLASSVKLGVAHAREQGAHGVLIALADMPRVTAAHIMRLFDAAAGPDTVVASSDGEHLKPPALCGAGRFDFLRSSAGETCARDLGRAGLHVVTSPAELIDVDTPEDLITLKELLKRGH